jgi:GNAT superfamily N-acetyltransferase
LIAKIGDAEVGCKVGYFEANHFYSWIGGVLPEYRKRGVAAKLADVQEDLVKQAGVHIIRMKTRNRFTEMLLFVLSRGFYIAEVEQKGSPGEWRITLYKNL